VSIPRTTARIKTYLPSSAQPGPRQATFPAATPSTVLREPNWEDDLIRTIVMAGDGQPSQAKGTMFVREDGTDGRKEGSTCVRLFDLETYLAAFLPGLFFRGCCCCCCCVQAKQALRVS
jgi:hypothetical protein